MSCTSPLRLASAAALKSVLLAGLAASGFAHADVVVVTPSALNNWALYSTDSSGIVNTGSATAQFVNGAATPPLGTGSVQLGTASGAGDGSAQLRNSAWAGTRIDALTSLSYSTYSTAWNGSQLPYLTIWLDTDNNGTRDDRLWFEPTYSRAGAGNGNPSPQADPVLNQWQTWDALDGMWYSDVLGGPGANAMTLSQYLALRPDATIINDAGQGIGGIRIASGFASASDNFNAYVDNFTIGTAAGSKTYNFELTTPTADVPEPGSLGLVGLALASLALLRRGRRA
jgi:hypothetical protein